METFPEQRYLSNIIGVVFIVISLISMFSIEEKLIRHEKDAEIDENYHNINKMES